MNFYMMTIYLFGLLPFFHLILIGMIFRKSNGKISTKLISIYKILTIEIVIFLLSVIVPIPDGGIFMYYIFAVIVGIPVLIFQLKYFKNFAHENQQHKMTISNLVWVIAIVLGLIYWIIYYITDLLPTGI